MKRAEIIFWFRTPPKVSKGAFNFVTKAWGNKVIYIINNDFSEDRKKTNWNDGDLGEAEVIMLSDSNNEEKVIAQIFKDYPNAIHVVSAFTNIIQKKIRKYILKPGIKLVVFSERPDIMGNTIERFFRTIYFQFKYRYLRSIFDPYVQAFLPLGGLGVSTYETYGWQREKMFPFMYNPIIHKNKNCSNIKTAKDGALRFLYVGRFYYKTKGLDILMNAVTHLEGKWHLDLVGGYGKNKDEVIAWAEKQPNVQYLGSWQSQDVCTNMMQYDVIIVPSNYDGWNLLPNEAIYAGIATIVTNEAVSDEIITTSGAGVVIPAHNSKAMAQAMQQAINDHELVEKWKENSKIFAIKISPQTVGRYFIDIMDYTFYNNGQERPKCPWL